MTDDHQLKPIHDRFNDYHLAVSCYIEQTKWILENTEIDEQPIYLMIRLVEDLEGLTDEQNLRSDISNDALSPS